MYDDTTITPIIGPEFSTVVTAKIAAAKRTINIIVFDWRWYPSQISAPAQIFNNTIIAAAIRGVQIKAVTNIDDVIKILNDNKIKAKKLITKKLLHTKLMIIDDEIIICGSHNYTQNAFTLNHELSIMIENCPGMDRYIKYFNNIYDNG